MPRRVSHSSHPSSLRPSGPSAHGPRAARAPIPLAALLAALTLAPAVGAQQTPQNRPAATPPGGASSGGTLPPGGTEGNWVTPARTLEGTRYSPLTQITTDNVKNLKEVWHYVDGIKDGHEGQPLVVNNTMYMVTPYPDKLIAFDLTKPGPAKKWEYDPPIDPTSFGKACCDDVNRGAAYADGKIIYNTLDNHTVAVDANTGKQVWRTKLDDANKGATMTMAPLVVKNKVIVGVSGGEMGVWGWVAALDVKSGKELWRARNTGPDKDVLIGPDFKPYYSWMQGKDMGVKTWRGDQWKIGGAAVWGWITYDPETNLIYYGTSNPGTWNPDLRPGDNLWATTIFARDPDNGHAKWAFAATPHDEWDFDDVNESIVADLPMNGQTRKVIVHFDRNGFAYTIDRTNGQVLVAQPFQYINWAKGFDLKSGRAIIDSSKETHQGRLTKNICPSSTGARDQQPAAYSPQTHLFYTPSTNLCMDYGGVEAKYIAGTPYVGAAVRMYAGPGGNDARGEFMAWDAATGKKVWGIKEKYPVWAGALATAGGVVFYGTMDGDFKAVDAKTGKELWKTHFDSGIIGNPITYTGPDKKQYVAIYEGVGGWAGAIVPGNLSPDDPWAALGAVGAMADLPKDTKPGGALHVFALSQ
ncbi:MAG TPA: PQQ-dependent dehydrogenase, methanol/ethanol family [Gemmatimonadaceae bacterium]|nr:PQQ-dependent dehydrogenase, methanol/ethanol family [Gemmatimonadaceae bacterium]